MATPIADMVEMLLSREMSREVSRDMVSAVTAAARAAELAAQVVVDAETGITKRRVGDRERQRRRRAKMSRDSQTPPLSITSLSSKDSQEKERRSEGVRARAKPKLFPLPENWHPTKAPLLPEDQLELERFKHDALAHARMYANWDAAFQKWLISPYRNGGNGNGTTRQQTQRVSPIKAALDAQLERFERQARDDDEVRARSARMLPNGGG